MRKTLMVTMCILPLAFAPPVCADLYGQAEGFEYSVGTEGTAVITGYEGESDALLIPRSLDGYPVTGIGERAFAWMREMGSVSIPEGIRGIGAWAFEDCENLLSVDLPRSLVAVGDGAFVGCSSLGRISVDTLNPVYADIDGVLFDKPQRMLHSFPAGKPQQEYSIPQGIRTIGNDAFHSCENLQSIHIPDSVTTIGEDAFRNLEALKEIDIPGSVKSIGAHGFASCGLTGVRLSEGLRSIGEGAFSYCDHLTAMTLPESLTDIGEEAFSLCFDLREVLIPAGVTSIGQEAFSSCSGLTAFRVAPRNPVYASVGGVLYDKAQRLLHSYPNGKPGETYAVPQGTRAVGAYAFYSCDALLSVTLPDSVTDIGVGAFSFCGNLGKAFIPESVTSIGWHAFFDSSRLTLDVAKGSYAEQYALENEIERIVREP